MPYATINSTDNKKFDSINKLSAGSSRDRFKIPLRVLLNLEIHVSSKCLELTLYISQIMSRNLLDIPKGT